MSFGSATTERDSIAMVSGVFDMVEMPPVQKSGCNRGTVDVRTIVSYSSIELLNCCMQIARQVRAFMSCKNGKLLSEATHD